MKLFNWKDKKLRQSPGFVCIEMFVQGNSTPHARKCHTRVCREKVDRHDKNIALPHATCATRPKAMEQCWEPGKDSDLHSKVRCELLAIGILGVSGLENNAVEDIRVERDQSVGAVRFVETTTNMVHVQEQVLGSQTELEQPSCIPSAPDESRTSHNLTCKDGLESNNEKQTDINDGRAGNPNKASLTTEFDETPIESVKNCLTDAFTLAPPMTGTKLIVAKEIREQKSSAGFLLKKFLGMKNQITNASFNLDYTVSESESAAAEGANMQKKGAPDSLKRVISVIHDNVMRTLLTSERAPEQSPRDPVYPSKLRKLLNLIVRKRRIMKVGLFQQLARPRTVADIDSDSFYDDGENGHTQISKVCSKGCSLVTEKCKPSPRESKTGSGSGPEGSFLQGLAKDEFWINTDDEYVVLERRAPTLRI